MMRTSIILAVVMGLAACASPTEEGPADAGDPVDMQASGDRVDTGGEASDVSPAIDDDWGEVPEDDASELQSQLDLAVANLGLPGAAMSVVRGPGHEIWAGASGTADLAGDVSWNADRRFRIGSVTKTFTTALLLQLVEEEVVSLDDPLEAWVPGYYDGLGVTVRHLATNTSGIVSYNYVGSFDESKVWTPDELVEWAMQHEPELRFEPGSQWEYSNTNFVLIGLILEAATGEDYADLVDSRLLEPLGLQDTYVASSSDPHPDLAPCYDEEGDDVSASFDPSFGWAAGAIVSTPRDLARWAAALYGGDVLSPPMLSLMTTPAVDTGDGGIQYGMGAFIETDGTDTIYGHTGGIGGFMTYMYFHENESAAVIAMANVLGTDLRDLSAYGWSVVVGFQYP